MWKGIIAVLIIAGVAVGTAVSALNVRSVRIILSHGVVKVVSVVNARVSIPSYGVIDYEPASIEEEAIEKPNIIKEITKSWRFRP